MMEQWQILTVITIIKVLVMLKDWIYFGEIVKLLKN